MFRLRLRLRATFNSNVNNEHSISVAPKFDVTTVGRINPSISSASPMFQLEFISNNNNNEAIWKIAFEFYSRFVCCDAVDALSVSTSFPLSYWCLVSCEYFPGDDTPIHLYSSANAEYCLYCCLRLWINSRSSSNECIGVYSVWENVHCASLSSPKYFTFSWSQFLWCNSHFILFKCMHVFNIQLYDLLCFLVNTFARSLQTHTTAQWLMLIIITLSFIRFCGKP